ncbi:sirohydrochlorin chelatase [Peptococcus simiae]|uniref:Sirohydrochlorin chelatase n=1 Tax=Peptococcus simiae TaxID=1643805 RepID=A0ABW9GZ83_9FIRM
MNKQGVVIFGHGSRRREGLATVTETAARFARAHPEYVTAHAFLEFAKPTLPESVVALYEQGVRTFYIIPLFLAMGTHCAKHLPDMISNLKKTYPDAGFFLAPPLGADPLLSTIVEKRVTGLVDEQTKRGDGSDESAPSL